MKVKINTHGNPLPESHGEWVDLYTAEDIVLEPLDFKIISLGIAMELPAGYYAQVVPRSSTCKNFGVIMANSVGIIEHSYCGNDDIWGFPAVAIRHTEIPKGTRICQFRLVKQDEPVEFEQVEDLGNPNRGAYAVLERQDGTVGLAEAQRVQFLDTAKEFAKYEEEETKDV